MRKRKPVLLNGEALMVDGKVLEFDAVDQEELDGKIDAPQTARVGEVLTVEEVDEDGKPKKWKAAKVSGTFVCTFNEGEDGWITCDKTVEEIITANNDGKDVIGHYYGDIYRLSTPFETGGGYGNPIFSNLGVGVLSIIQYDAGHFGINRIRLSDIAPEDVPNSYEVPVYVPTKDGMQWQYGRPLLATDYAMNELTDEEKALMQKNLGIDALSLVKYTGQELTEDQKQQARENIGIKIAQKYVAGLVRAYNTLDDYDMLRYNSLYVFPDGTSAVPKEIPIISAEKDLNYSLWQGTLAGGVVNFAYTPFINAGLSYPCYLQRFTQTYPNASQHYLTATYLITDLKGVQLVGSSTKDWMQSGSTSWNFSSFINHVSLPSPATAQVGQIVKVKAVDADGKITETEAVDMPTQKTLKWITVQSFDLTETKRELIISTDTDGKSIADYNPVGLSLILSTPADSTEESTNGAPWIYPSTTKFDNAIRIIGSISGWKTIARDSAFVFNGGSSAMSCSGNVNTSLSTYKLDGYALDGVRIFFNSANDHLPVGTHVEVAILCEVEE